jgi:hypothetical protein
VLDSAQSEQFRGDLEVLEDTRRFLERSSSMCDSQESLAQELMIRHGDVQQGKFDHGHRKMSWLNVVSDHISLNMTRVGGLDREATLPGDIAPHPYRLFSADALITASGGL